ncbi:MAG: hypothetical protein EBU90_10380 [Proteobacteria bacterium]|nr:hypothetical protein [Pseudomonadota bacterium]NBP14142.1 hypothetical protein [bacterium]
MNEEMITWSDDEPNSKSAAISKFSESIEAYSGLNKSYGSHYRNFIDIEPNRSVKPGFTRNDYYAFRPEEAVPNEQRRIIKMCMDAYDKVGIIRNIIDLMGDFGSQGIQIVHRDKSVEKFYQQWFKSVNGKERSERFLNNLYKCGNVIIYRSYAKVTPQLNNYMKSIASDIKVEVPNAEKNLIPWRYNFFNPLTVSMKDGNLSLFMGLKNFSIKADNFFDKFQSGNIPSHVLESLPKNVKQSLLNGERDIPLDPERLGVFYYKKDDWRQWANPMIYAILDDIIMLEKMRLADLSALDGAISNIRLWTLGNLEYKILPNKAAINKLRDILASNVGGGTMELVWGPELSFTESSSEVYKFLGSEKYTSVLNSIYAGLGVPPTLTGMATNGGGFTNNFISLKTLVERLQYGRDQLTGFWEKEIEIIRKAMGFRHKAHIQFDQMTLSDEAAEKNLLIQLADRDIISHETLIERFKEIPDIEKIRLKREMEKRDTVGPPKASPFHNANQKFELEKINKQAKVAKQNAPKSPNVPNPNGRPLLKQDTNVRKKRVDKPKSKPGVAELLVWSENAMSAIATLVVEPYLHSLNKSNLRQLTKNEVKQLENIKLDIFTNLNLLSSVSNEDIVSILKSNSKTPVGFRKMLKANDISLDKLSLEDYKNSVLGKYIEYIVQI